MSYPRSSLPALKLTLTYEDVRKLKDALKDAPQYDGLDSLRERLFIGNGLPRPRDVPVGLRGKQGGSCR